MSTSVEKPSVVIVSSCSTKPKSLIKLITGCTSLEENNPHKISHPWQIETKYYTTEVIVHGLTEHYSRDDEFNDSVEALIILMDSNKETGLLDLKMWENIENECNPDIKLLVSNYCTSETKISRSKAIEWCLKRGFELVELYPSPQKHTDESEENNVIQEKFGVERIIEALQTHIWPNLEMKTQKTGESEQNVDKKQMGGDALSEDVLTNEGLDDFMDLLSRLQVMKESIQSMPTKERKQCAEQMVTAFWRAIGGDEEEIAE